MPSRNESCPVLFAAAVVVALAAIDKLPGGVEAGGRRGWPNGSVRERASNTYSRQRATGDDPLLMFFCFCLIDGCVLCLVTPPLCQQKPPCLAMLRSQFLFVSRCSEPVFNQNRQRGSTPLRVQQASRPPPSHSAYLASYLTLRFLAPSAVRGKLPCGGGLYEACISPSKFAESTSSSAAPIKHAVSRGKPAPGGYTPPPPSSYHSLDAPPAAGMEL